MTTNNTRFRGNRKYPNSITVTDDPKSHTLALQQIIEGLNIGQRRTKDISNSFVRLSELEDLGLIEIVGDGFNPVSSSSATGTSNVDVLDDLSDVDTTGVADGDTIVYDSATQTWLPGAPTGGGITASDMYGFSLNDLSDVSFYLPVEGDVLTYVAATGTWDSRPAGGFVTHDGAFIRRTGAAQSIANSTHTPIQFDTEDFDNSAYATLGTNNDRLTVSETGWYAITGSLAFAANSTGSRMASISKNGSITGTDFFSASRLPSPTVKSVALSVTAIIFLNAGDYIQLLAHQDSGGALGTDTGTYPSLGIHRLGARPGPTGPAATQGRHSIWVPAGAMVPSASAGCQPLSVIGTVAGRPDVTTLNFDTTTQEFAQFALRMPKMWDEGTVTFAPLWSHAATTTNFGVVWQLDAVAVSDDDTISVAFGTAQTSTDTGGTTDDLYVGPESSAITIAGSPAAEDLVYFRIGRVPANGSDTLAVDARLLGVTVYVTTNADTDA